MPSMNAPTHAPPESTCLVEIIELKWLLSAYGVALHVERLQSDDEYARKLLSRVAALPSATLRAAAERLVGCLGLASDCGA